MINGIPSAADVDLVKKQSILRAIPANKINIHFGDFNSIIDVLNRLGIEPKFFTSNFSNLLEASVEMTKFIENINKITPIEISDKLKQAAIGYLSEEDNLQESDIIFVYGSKNLGRAKKACELFHEGFSNLIYFSGSHPFEDPNRPNEAEEFKKFAVSQYQIPEDKIIADPYPNSITMVHNTLGFLNYIDGFPNIKKVIVIGTNHILRRGWATFNKFMPDSLKILRIGSGFLEQCNSENWTQSKEGWSRIIEEYCKIKIQHIDNVS